MSDERFTTPRERRRNSQALVLAIDQLAAQHTREEWSKIFREHDVWWAPINSVDDLLEDAQVIASGAFVDVPVHTGEATPESFNGVATPVDFSATPAGPAGPPPHIGADTDALLRQLGIEQAQVQRLRDSGVIT